MKVICIALFMILCSPSTIFEPNLAGNCRGVSPYCSCSTTCDDNLISDCYLGLTCSCACRGDNVKTERANPTMNTVQKENSEKAEAYFRTLGNTELADGLKGLRELLTAGTFDVYHSEAAYVQAIFDTLSEREKEAYENWALKTLDVLEE